MSLTQAGNEPTNDTIYAVGDLEASRYRLAVQTRLFSNYVRVNARRLVGDAVGSILDLGCGEGQLGFVLRESYPQARLVGIDADAKSIAGAQRRAVELGLSGVEFSVGNVEQELPDGPFDLIYASLILSYTHAPQAVAQSAYARLAAGGSLWVRDFMPSMQRDPAIVSFYGGKFARMTEMIRDVVIARGGHLDLMSQLPDWLAAMGASDIRQEEERYVCGGSSEEGRVMLSINLGSFYALIPAISRMTGTPHHELMQLYTDIVNEAMTSKAEFHSAMLNVVAQKPDLYHFQQVTQ